MSPVTGVPITAGDGSSITLSAVQTRVASAVAYIDLDDWANAEKYLISARAMLMAVPDSAAGDRSLTLQRDIEGLLTRVARLKAESSANSVGFLRTTKITYVQATD